MAYFLAYALLPIPFLLVAFRSLRRRPVAAWRELWRAPAAAWCLLTGLGWSAGLREWGLLNAWPDWPTRLAYLAMAGLFGGVWLLILWGIQRGQAR